MAARRDIVGAGTRISPPRPLLFHPWVLRPTCIVASAPPHALADEPGGDASGSRRRWAGPHSRRPVASAWLPHHAGPPM
eukprot:scaffold5310_cov378-Prasinococcus_capsulatus_cf.AAC.6